MKVYIALEFNEEHHEVLGVFSSRELADDCAKKREAAERREDAQLSDRLRADGHELAADLPFGLSYGVDCWEIDGERAKPD